MNKKMIPFGGKSLLVNIIKLLYMKKERPFKDALHESH